MISLTAVAAHAYGVLAAFIPEDSYDDTMAVAEAVGVVAESRAS